MQEADSTPIEGTRLQGEWVTSEVAVRLRHLTGEFDLLQPENRLTRRQESHAASYRSAVN